VYQEFTDRFPGLKAYREYQEPGWYMVRVGDYRSKTELYKDLEKIRRDPMFRDNAHWVPTNINYPDLNQK
jgi:hypothetical protein